MRNALTAFISAASFCALVTAASAQTVPPNPGAPLYSYYYTAPQPGAVGSCDIISGNRVCSAAPVGPGYGVAPLGPVGALVGAPFTVLGAVTGPMIGQSVVASGETYAPATSRPPYPQPGSVGYCEMISGNRVCM